MKFRQKSKLIVMALLSVLTVLTSCQQKEQKQEKVQLGMTTTIPEGIAIPDKVETRMGTLNFRDGFPDKATVEKLYDNLDFQRAVQSYLLALPAVSMMGLREGLTKLGPANFTIPTFETMMD